MVKHVMDADLFAEAMKSAHDSSPAFHATRTNPSNHEDAVLTRNSKMLIVSGRDNYNQSTFELAQPAQSSVDHNNINQSPTKMNLKKDQSKKGLRASPQKKVSNKENEVVQRLDSASQSSPQKSLQ